MYVQNKKKYQRPKNSYSYPNNKNAIQCEMSRLIRKNFAMKMENS